MDKKEEENIGKSMNDVAMELLEKDGLSLVYGGSIWYCGVLGDDESKYFSDIFTLWATDYDPRQAVVKASTLERRKR